jgi:hypothetical protein
MSNINDFEAGIFSGLDSLRHVIKDVLHTSGVKNFSVYNTGQLCTSEPGAKMTSASVRELLAVMWHSEDPVHPSEDAYSTLACNIVSLLEAASEKANNTHLLPPQPSQPLKRPRWLDKESSNTVSVHLNIRGRGQGRGHGRGRGLRFRG